MTLKIGDCDEGLTLWTDTVFNFYDNFPFDVALTPVQFLFCAFFIFQRFLDSTKQHETIRSLKSN